MTQRLSLEKLGELFEAIDNELTGKLSELAKIADLNLSEDYIGADLSNEDLSEDNLSNINLSNANLSNTNLSNTNLSNANLSRADLSGADLSGADLTNADLTEANLSNANLFGANLYNTNLINANVSHVNFKDASLLGAKNLTMKYEELKEVIVKPAEKLGVTFQEGLVKRILDDVESEPGNLPLLEFALTELWKRRKGKQLTHAAYEDIGEVKGALARHADEKYGNLTDNEKEKVRRIFIQLVRPGEGTEDTRRLATKAELGEASWGLVKQLADARLVVTSRNPEDQETVEVVHEALIRNWRELRQWIDTERSFRAWQDRLRIGIHQWKKTQRDEGALLRGAALVEAEEKLKQRREDLCEEEEEFIETSVALRDREH